MSLFCYTAKFIRLLIVTEAAQSRNRGEKPDICKYMNKHTWLFLYILPSCQLNAVTYLQLRLSLAIFAARHHQQMCS